MSSNNNSSGMGFGTILFLVFLTLKLTHYIDWSWWWVCAPLWVPLVVVLGILCAWGLVVAVPIVIAGIIAIIAAIKSK